jgi:hypothetical protein
MKVKLETSVDGAVTASVHDWLEPSSTVTNR